MARSRNLDIIVEMAELIDELIREIKQDLNYFRVSVYKTETAAVVREKIEKLRFVGQLYPGANLTEPFSDYDAELANPVISYVPGECSFTARTTRLLNGIEGALAANKSHPAGQKLDGTNAPDGLITKIRKCRSELLAICRHGSRHWTFFQGL